MSKKITKAEFADAITKAVSKEVEELRAKAGNGTAALAVSLMGISIGAKIMESLFENENEIEIITDKE